VNGLFWFLSIVVIALASLVLVPLALAANAGC